MQANTLQNFFSTCETKIGAVLIFLRGNAEFYLRTFSAVYSLVLLLMRHMCHLVYEEIAVCMI